MDTRIQFRVDEKTKHLAQLMAEKQGRTLSDACRHLIEQLAAEQKKSMSHDHWLTEQINQAFNKLDAGHAIFLTQEEASSRMLMFKEKVRQRSV